MQFLVSLVCSVVVAGLSGCVSGPRALRGTVPDSDHHATLDVQRSAAQTLGNGTPAPLEPDDGDADTKR